MRRLLCVNGTKHWCNQTINNLISDLPLNAQSIVYCGTDQQTLTRQQVNLSSSSKRAEIERYLGSECSVLIINCFNGFNPELFCALCGTVQSPGIIILMSPSISQWPSYPDPDYLNLCSFPYTEKDIKGRFLDYFIFKLKSFVQFKFFDCLSQAEDERNLINHLHNEYKHQFLNASSTNIKPILLSRQHEQLINSVEHFLNNLKTGVVILSGKRGRGKSSVLGMALKAYAANNNQAVHVCIVSQTRSNIEPIYKQLASDDSPTLTDQLIPQSLYLSFRPPDEFLKAKPDIDLLIIDEAAAIPLPQLYKILQTHQNIILSTTTDGYEGTGMGFTSKLNTYLNDKAIPVSRIELTYPLRWAEDDVVEQFLKETLFIGQNEIPKIARAKNSIDTNKLKFKKLNRNKLIRDTNLIKQLFSLLSSAHYRTTPGDLRYMLDAPDVEIWVAQCNEAILAAIMLGHEGGLPESIHNDIWLGKRRLQGHLIPQCLTAQCGFRQTCKLNYNRILRIAVHKAYQNMGIGKRLANHVLGRDLRNTNLDYFGVSFGFETKLYQFWRALGFFAVKLGHRENARSGTRSLMMLKPCSDKTSELSACLRKRHENELAFLSKLDKLMFENNHACLLDSHHILPDSINCEAQEKLDIYSFAHGNRQFSHCHWVLSKYTNQSLDNKTTKALLNTDQIKLLNLKVLQNKSWKTCADILGYTGKKETLINLRLAFAVIYTAVWGNKS